MPTTTRTFGDRARFYSMQVAGQAWSLPSVTTVLDVISKPALGPWYAKEERKAFETAILELASQSRTIAADHLLDAVITMVTGVKAAEKAKIAAGAIGTAAHAGIEWHTRRLLGEDAGPEPQLPPAAQWAVEAWKDWAKAVAFTPLAVERPVYCLDCGFAGTVDWIARVEDVVTLGDYKTGKAIYPESFLQNLAYRHAAAQQGLVSQQGVIVRLPKVVDDPAFEAMLVPELSFAEWEAAFRLWRWWRRMDGKPTGSTPRCGIH